MEGTNYITNTCSLLRNETLQKSTCTMPNIIIVKQHKTFCTKTKHTNKFERRIILQIFSFFVQLFIPCEQRFSLLHGF